MSDRYVERYRRMRAALTRSQPVVDLPLLLGFELAASEIGGLQHVVCDYLWHSAFESGVNLEPPTGPEWFAKHAATLRKLPNVTPNGVVMPKSETTAAYNLLHHMVVSIVYKDINPTEVAAIFAPINVRIVDGQPNARVDARPRSSTKVHSDVWAAEPSRSLTLFLTVMGDTEKTTVDFLEPTEFPAEFQRPMADYLEGAALANGAKKYPACFRNSHLLAMDAFCLHQTIKSGGGYRISLDFRLLYRRRLESDAYFDTPRLQNYRHPPLWAGLGQSHMLIARKSIKEFVPDVTLDAFASRFDVTGL